MFWIHILLYIGAAIGGGGLVGFVGFKYISRMKRDFGWDIVFMVALTTVVGMPLGAILSMLLLFAYLQFGVVGIVVYVAALALMCLLGWLYYTVPKMWEQAASQQYNAQFQRTEQDIRRLLDAARAGDLASVKAQLTAGTFVDTYYTHDPDYGETALMLAAHTGNTEMVDYLLAHGADPSVRNDRGKTAELLALESGHADTAALLAETSRQRRLTG